jgi:hypothetical protein
LPKMFPLRILQKHLLYSKVCEVCLHFFEKYFALPYH